MIRQVLFTAFLAATALAGPAWLPSAGTAAAWHGNITNANRPADVIGALRLGAEFGAARRQPLGRDDTLLTAISARAEAWPRFDGLDRAGAGARAATRAAADRAAADARPLGTVTVKGRSEPVEIFAIDAPLSSHTERMSPDTTPPFPSP